MAEQACEGTSWWNRLPLTALNARQWEALCDGCGRCCLHKLLDEATGEVYYTGIHCRFLDEYTCRCSNYEQRSVQMPDCIHLTRQNTADLDWLPGSCAYRLRSHGEALPYWHPLETGDPDSVHREGISIRGRAVSDEYVHPESYDEHIISWVE
ncbi:MAG: YcgN family cysteine cluster protein [Parahaliea sp.]